MMIVVRVLLVDGAALGEQARSERRHQDAVRLSRHRRQRAIGEFCDVILCRRTVSGGL